MAKAAAKKPVARSVESLKTLLAQINKLAPKRSKVSDGWIGDVKHMARHSDHNPEPDGTVDARDFTNDPNNGFDSKKFSDAIVASKDPRLSYIICNGQIIHGRKGAKNKKPWMWYKYNGPNGHYHHVHVSVLDEGQDDTTPWKIDSAFKKGSSTPPVGAVVITKKEAESILKKGSKGEMVEELQKNLTKAGYDAGAADGDFGDKTDEAVRDFQKDYGLRVDGWAGTRTQRKLGEVLEKMKLQPKIVAAKIEAEEANAKVDAAKDVVNAAANNGKVSTTEVVAGAGVIATTVRVGTDVVNAINDGYTSAYQLAVSTGPWILLGLVVIGGGIYIYNDRRNKRLEAKAVKQVI